MEELKEKINKFEIMFINEKDIHQKDAIYQVIFFLIKQFFLIFKKMAFFSHF